MPAYKVIATEAYLPDEWQEGLDEEGATTYAWSKHLFVQNQIVRQLAPDYDALYDEGVLSVTSVVERIPDAEVEEALANAPQVPGQGDDLFPSTPDTIKEFGSDYDPHAETETTSQIDSNAGTQTEKSEVTGAATVPQDYDKLGAREIIAKAQKWDLSRLEATKQHEASHANRSTVLKAFDEQIAKKGGK